jgi:hypothetical protein
MDKMSRIESYLLGNNPKCPLSSSWTNCKYTWMRLFNFLPLLEIYSTLESLWPAIEVRHLLIIRMEHSFTWTKFWRKKKLGEYQLIQVAKYLMSIYKIKKISCWKIMEIKKIRFSTIKKLIIICHKDKL